MIGNISITAVAPGQPVVVTGGKTWKRGRSRDVHYAVTQSGNDYYVCAMWRASGRCDATGYRARTNSGWLTIFSLFHHGSDVTANMVAQLPSDVAVDARTIDGSVKVIGSAAGVSAKTVNGSVVATNVSGRAVLATTNGAVRLMSQALGPSDSVHLNVVNGVVSAQLPADVQGTFDLRANNGVVSSDFPLQPNGSGRTTRHLTGQIGTVTRPIYMHTVNGVVTVTAKPIPASH